MVTLKETIKVETPEGEKVIPVGTKGILTKGVAKFYDTTKTTSVCFDRLTIAKNQNLFSGNIAEDPKVPMNIVLKTVFQYLDAGVVSEIEQKLIRYVE